MKYRWLDTDEPVISVGRGSALKGKTGRILTLPVPRAIGNVLVDFGDTQAVVPAGTLRKKRRERGEATGTPRIPESLEEYLQEDPNSCGGGIWHSGASAARATQFDYEGWWELTTSLRYSGASRELPHHDRLRDRRLGTLRAGRLSRGGHK